MASNPITSEEAAQIAQLEGAQARRRLANAIACVRSALDDVERAVARKHYASAVGTVRNMGPWVVDLAESAAKLALLQELRPEEK